MLVHSPHYNTDLAVFGVNKPFALDRGELVLKALQTEFGRPFEALEPMPISRDEILLVHTQRYLDSLADVETWLATFEFSEVEYRPERAVKPLTALLDDILLKCGGTKLACELALQGGLTANLGGGYHHAFPDQGRGFCVLHDIAIAIQSLRTAKRLDKAMVIDLDFHQGDGTALIFKDDPNVFTLSVHSQEGWPDEKQESDLDVGILESETGEYLERTRQAVLHALEIFTPELVVFVAGSDPYEKDVLPGTRFIKLSLDTLEERDKFVIDTVSDRGIPLAMVFAGGYGPDVWEVHYRAVRHLVRKRFSADQLSAAHRAT